MTFHSTGDCKGQMADQTADQVAADRPTPAQGPAILGPCETHIPVADLRRSIGFYRDRIGLALAIECPRRNLAFFWVGDRTQGMLGLWGAGPAPLHRQLHFAFRSSRKAIVGACAALRAAGVPPLGLHGLPLDEPEVIGWMPALSICFRDPDGHAVEMLHLLDEAPDPAFGIQRHSAWLARAG